MGEVTGIALAVVSGMVLGTIFFRWAVVDRYLCNQGPSDRLLVCLQHAAAYRHRNYWFLFAVGSLWFELGHAACGSRWVWPCADRGDAAVVASSIGWRVGRPKTGRKLSRTETEPCTLALTTLFSGIMVS